MITAAMAASATARDRRNGMRDFNSVLVYLKQPTKTFRLTLILESEGEALCGALGRGARDAANELGIVLDIRSPRASDLRTQAEILADEARRGPDAILLAPVDLTILNPPIQDAIEAKMPVFTIRTQLAPDLAVAHVGADNVEEGRLAARSMVEALSDRGRVVIHGTSAESLVARQRQEGFEEVINAHPKIELVEGVVASDDPSVAFARMASSIRTYPDLGGILALDRAAIDGSAKAVASAGVRESVWVIGFETDATHLDSLRDGLVDSLVVGHLFTMGGAAVRLAHEFLISRDAPALNRVWIDSSVMTRDSIEDRSLLGELDSGNCSQPVEIVGEE